MDEVVSNEKPSWAKQLKRRGLYYEGLVDGDDIEPLLKAHRRSTVTSYGTRTGSRLITKPTTSENAQSTEGNSTVNKTVIQNKVRYTYTNFTTYNYRYCILHSFMYMNDMNSSYNIIYAIFIQKKLKLFWSHTVGCHTIELNSTPFSIGEKHANMGCITSSLTSLQVIVFSYRD